MRQNYIDFYFKVGAFLTVLSLCIIAPSKAQTNDGDRTKWTQSLVQVHGEVPLKVVLQKIRKERGITFLYDSRLIEGKTVPARVLQSDELGKRLYQLLKECGLKYINQTASVYVIMPRTQLQKMQQGTIRGTVTSAATGDPLSGVNIIVRGTSNGTSTGPEGYYELDVSSLQDTLVFSYVGFKARLVPIKGRTEIDVTLQPQTIMGEELVVVGYGTQQRKKITGAISSVSSEVIENKPVTDALGALQGRVAGLQITSNSGAPGSSKTIRIRGTGTLGDSSPLIVINGNPAANYRALNPASIASIEVLKDASAAAIYGSRGANGVILITTKSGTPGESKITFNMYRGFQQVPNKLNLTNATQWAKVYNKILTNAGKPPAVDNPSSLGVGTDWQDKLFRTAPIASYNLAFSGGNETTTYRVSGGYFMQKGTIKNTSYRRANFTISATHDVRPWLTFGEDIRFTYSKKKSVNSLNAYSSPITTAIQADPTFPVRNENGEFASSDYSSIGNPIAAITYVNPILNSRNIAGNIHAILEPIEGLSIKSQFNVAFYNGRNVNYIPEYYVSSLQQNAISSMEQSSSGFVNWEWRNTATYQTSIEKNQFEILIGMSTQSNYSTNLYGSGLDLPAAAEGNTSLQYLSLASTGYQASSGASEYTMLSYFTRLNYNYDDRYLLQVTLRRDGSSKFGKNNQFGIFPSVSAGWIISNEEFMNDVEFLSFLKLRGSYGELGNQTALSNYAYVATVKSNIPFPIGEPEGPVLGQTPNSVANPNLKWETVKEWNIGLDIGLFNNRLNFTANYYNRKTTDLLVQLPIPDLAGALNPPFTNAGSIVNKGLEFIIEYSNTAGSGFYYSFSGNLATLHNEVTYLANEGASFPSGFVQGQTVSRTAVGHPIGAFYGYVTNGIFQNWDEVYNHALQNQNPDGLRTEEAARTSTAPGDIRFKDLNGDGVINSEDQTYIGNPIPTLTYGFSGTFAFKNVDLSFTFVGEAGNEVFAGWKLISGVQPSFFNYYAPVMLNAWHGQGTTSKYPRLIATDPNNNSRISDRYVEDASYLRLSNLQLGYTLPQSWLNSMHLKNVRIYINVQNLVTFTSYNGYDPNIGTNTSEGPLDLGVDNARYPQSRTFTVGLNLSF